MTTARTLPGPAPGPRTWRVGRDQRLETRRPDRLALAVVVAAVVALPVLHPKLPGRVAPVDAVMVAGIMAVLLWAGSNRQRVHLPYALPVCGLVLTGGIAALLGGSPGGGILAVSQDLFLLGWCGAVASICRTAAAVGTVLRAWVLTVLVWAALLAVALVAGLPALAGVDSSGEGRARLLFDHPNMAGNYFAVGFFVVMASRYPRHPVARAGAYVLLVIAMLLAGSNAALMSLPLGLAITAFANVRDRAGVVHAVAAAVGVGLATILAGTMVLSPVLTQLKSNDSSLVKYSVGRSSRSAEGREGLFASQLDLYQRGTLVGIGPSATKDVLRDESASQVKEAHNDYLATLVERGPLGAAALLALIGAVTVRAVSLRASRLAPAYRAVVPNPAALSGLLVAFAVTAVTHEVLHYRHLWTILGVIGAIFLFGRADGEADADSPGDHGRAVLAPT